MKHQVFYGDTLDLVRAFLDGRPQNLLTGTTA